MPRRTAFQSALRWAVFVVSGMFGGAIVNAVLSGRHTTIVNTLGFAVLLVVLVALGFVSRSDT